MGRPIEMGGGGTRFVCRGFGGILPPTCKAKYSLLEPEANVRVADGMELSCWELLTTLTTETENHSECSEEISRGARGATNNSLFWRLR